MFDRSHFYSLNIQENSYFLNIIRDLLHNAEIHGNSLNYRLDLSILHILSEQ